jgi:hypothetical protein
VNSAGERPVRRHEWLAKAAFEAGLIVLGLVLAYAISEWRDSRVRDQRVRDARTSIRAELETNRNAITDVIGLNEALIGALHESAKTGQPYMDQIVNARVLTSTAWDATRDAAITNDLPFSELTAVGQAYAAQERYSKEIEFFSNQLYAGAVMVDLRKNPRHLAGILNDFTAHARGVKTRYEEALTVLK